MKKMAKFNIFSILVLLFFTIVFSSCFTFGSPNSVFVNFVGRDLDNFIEYQKTSQVSIVNMDYTVIFIKKYFIEMRPPEVAYRGKYLVSNLALRGLSENSEEITIFTKYHGTDPGSIKQVIVDKENNRLFFTVDEKKDGLLAEYLYIYDLKNMSIVKKIFVLDRNKYKREDKWWTLAHISDALFDESNGKMLFQIRFNLDTSYHEGRDYLSLDINSGETEEISQELYNETLEFLDISKSPFVYASKDGVKQLFFIQPHSDYLPANYKHKYNGIYINDGINNIRISTIGGIYYGDTPVWLEDGKYVIIGSYIFDTSGKILELKITEGNILTVY